MRENNIIKRKAQVCYHGQDV